MTRDGPATSGGAGYLRHMTPADLGVVMRLAGVSEAHQGAAVRADPGIVDRTLGSPEAARLLLRHGADDPNREALVRASPFLTFAVAVEQVALELRDATYVQEWVGPRQRIPLLGADDLRELLAAGERRVFLAALLDSYTRVSSGSVWRETRRGWRRRRFSELDPVELASTLDSLPESRHPAVHRRLGDLSLFLAGVFPDHTASRAFRPIDLERLGRAAAVGGPSGEALGEALETRGGVGLLDQLGARWYRLADRAQGPAAAPARLPEGIADRFVQARRALNVLADRHLFAIAREWFPAP